MLAPYHQRVVVHDDRDDEPDVVLDGSQGIGLSGGTPGARGNLWPSVPVVVFSWSPHPAAARQALSAGAAGYVSKRLTALELVEQLEAVFAGRSVVSISPLRDPAPEPLHRNSGPGELTPREAEIVALIAQGLSNKAIAELCFLSINSIKTYIRGAYRKMAVVSRSQAVVWAIAHGLAADVPPRDGQPVRTRPDDHHGRAPRS